MGGSRDEKGYGPRMEQQLLKDRLYAVHGRSFASVSAVAGASAGGMRPAMATPAPVGGYTLSGANPALFQTGSAPTRSPAKPVGAMVLSVFRRCAVF